MSYQDLRVIGNDREIDRLLNEVFTSPLTKGYVEIGEDNYCLPIAYTNCAESIHNFKVRDDDIYLAAFPRSGSTWSQEMIWLIVNNLNYEAAKERIGRRFPFFEFQSVYDKKLFEQNYEYNNSFQIMEGMSSPRCIKTHLHWSLLPEDITSGKKRPKIIYVLRNPKDTCLSYYHLSRIMGGYSGTFDEFFELFLVGRVPFGPFWKSVLSFWNRRNQTNILFIRYKEMKENLPEVIKNVATFLGKDLTYVGVEYLAKHLSFENMKRNPAVNLEKAVEHFAKITNRILSTEDTFIRSGKQGGYASVMSKELIDRFDIWTKENLVGTGLEVE